MGTYNPHKTMKYSEDVKELAVFLYYKNYRVSWIIYSLSQLFEVTPSFSTVYQWIQYDRHSNRKYLKTWIEFKLRELQQTRLGKEEAYKKLTTFIKQTEVKEILEKK